jgi:hypothetical protein
MTIEEAKQVRIVDFLAQLGHHAQYVKSDQYWYLSPLRDEQSPSFKVNDRLNEWYDFGAATGGDLVELGKYLYQTESVSEVLERILRLAGLPTTADSENLDFICLREYSPTVRISVIDYALRQGKGYGLVIIDGIRDLMLDINSTSESVEVINKMMEWSSRYDLHIHCVLHLNKGDNNVRGHIGTEMSNKAETVLVISKCNENPSVGHIIRD